jgi:hypothetical protein
VIATHLFLRPLRRVALVVLAGGKGRPPSPLPAPRRPRAAVRCTVRGARRCDDPPVVQGGGGPAAGGPSSGGGRSRCCARPPARRPPGAAGYPAGGGSPRSPSSRPSLIRADGVSIVAPPSYCARVIAAKPWIISRRRRSSAGLPAWSRFAGRVDGQGRASATSSDRWNTHPLQLPANSGVTEAWTRPRPTPDR